MNKKNRQGSRHNNGSALILVLWSLVLISFLAGEYLQHNRAKACLAINAWDSLQKKEAVYSTLHLFATDSWPIPDQENIEGTWFSLSPGGVDMRVKVDRELNRTNINTASNSKIKEKLTEILGEERSDEINQLTDAILDWRDADPLVRTNGAEEGAYASYKPANGPFKILTELLLVKGMTPDLFWGFSPEQITNMEQGISLFEAFTIYPKQTKRISILIPGKKHSYSFVAAFLEKHKSRWETVQIHQSMSAVAN